MLKSITAVLAVVAAIAALTAAARRVRPKRPNNSSNPHEPDEIDCRRIDTTQRRWQDKRRLAGRCCSANTSKTQGRASATGANAAITLSLLQLEITADAWRKSLRSSEYQKPPIRMATKPHIPATQPGSRITPVNG